eukprot:GHVR01028386.1.p1 GENE.GHVR01028386.1~~GHVR01028386.1.p1  ORF type:complete len:391 (-),score=55.01 GHVR01028386.1:2535-3707(-)
MNINSKKVCIMGLGHVGLPTACILAISGYSVLGVDIDPKVVSYLKSGKLTNLEPNLEKFFKKATQIGNLNVSTQVESADIYIVATPTLLGKKNQPDISCVYESIELIKPYIKRNNLVIIESTCPIGTTETIAKILNSTYSGIYVAYCPERIMPGNIIHELLNNNRIIGGIDIESTNCAVDFYQSFVLGEIEITNSKTAEAVKLAENSYRDINIAYANELSMIAEDIDIDVNHIIRLANKHPRVQILNPGVGVGGHCIAIDPWFLVASAPKVAFLTSKAREVNTNKTNWVIKKIKQAIKKNNANTIACLGLTYKADTSDTRNSPALDIVHAIEKENYVLRVDPYVRNTSFIYEALKEADIIVILIAHKEFKDIPSKYFANKVVLNFTGEIF